MANGSPGSPERMPGALFRAVGVLVLQKNDWSREALACEIEEPLVTLDIDYHVRTLKRPFKTSANDGSWRRRLHTHADH